MNYKTKRSIYNIITSFIGTMATVILGLIIPRLVLVNYGSETNGMINSINQFITYLSLFEAGIGTTALQALYKPIAEGNRNDINSIISELNRNYKKIGILYFIALISISFLYPFLVLNGNSNLGYIEVWLCVFFSGIGNVIMFFIQGKYRILLNAEGKSYILTTLQTIITIMISLFKIILINLGYSIVVVLVVVFLFNSIQILYILILIKRKYKWLNVNYNSSQAVLSQKGYVFISQLAWMVFQNTDILIITIFCGLKTVSVYSMYKLVLTNVQNILDIPISSTSFAMGQIYNTDKKRYINLLDCFEIYYSAIYFAIEASLLCFITPFIKLYTLGVNDVIYVDTYLPVLFILVELLTFMRKPMLNTITYAGHFKLTTPQTLIEMILNLFISVVAVIKFGIYGVLIGTIAALLYRFFDVVYYTNKILLNRNYKKTLIIYVINIILFFICIFIFKISHITINSYLQLLIYGFLYTLLFLGIYGLCIYNIFPKETAIVKEFIKSKFLNIKN